MAISIKRILLLGILILALFVAATILVLWLDRPLFYNTYAVGDLVPLPYWSISPPAGDELGSYCLADYRMNLLVLVLTPDREIATRSLWVAEGTKAARFSLNHDRGPSLRIDLRRDALFIILGDATVLSTKLEQGVAERIYKALRAKFPGQHLLTELESLEYVRADPALWKFLQESRHAAEQQGQILPAAATDSMHDTS